MKKGKSAGGTLPQRYYGQNISLTEEEKLFVDVMASHSGMRPATLARRLFYLGLAAFLEDRKLSLSTPEQVLQQKLIGFLDADPALREIKEIVATQNRQPSRTARKLKHSTG